MGGNGCKIKYPDFKNVGKVSWNIDLQLFADPDRTERPTPRKRRRAREEGRVPVSRELNLAVVFLFMIIILGFLGSKIVFGLIDGMKNLFYLDIGDFQGTFIKAINGFKEVTKMLLALFAGGISIGVLTGALQTRFLISFKSLKLDPNRINPIEGFKRMFSLRSVVELLKAILKVIIVGYVAYIVIKKRWGEMVLYPDMDIIESSIMLWRFIYELVIKCGIALLILSIFDYMYQRWEFEKSIMMTKHELKEEMKEVEGHPLVRRRQRTMMLEILRRRMMTMVPQADVVITNPDHYAVALKYDPDDMNAPIVVAKGMNEIAKRIIEIAKENDIPIVRNPELARRLYREVEIGEEIPPNLYRIVAEVLAYVYSLKG